MPTPDRCPVCYEEYPFLVSPPCKHVLCSKCFIKISSQSPAMCPQCRRNFPCVAPQLPKKLVCIGNLTQYDVSDRHVLMHFSNNILADGDLESSAPKIAEVPLITIALNESDIFSCKQFFKSQSFDFVQCGNCDNVREYNCLAECETCMLQICRGTCFVNHNCVSPDIDEYVE